MNGGESAARILVRTGGIWKATQIAETLTALDGLTCRVAVGSHIAETCQQFDYVISNLRALGLLEKGQLGKWGEAKTPTDIIGRTDYVKLVSLMRTMGVGVQQTDANLKFTFLVPDLLDLVPHSSRPEIESIRMASPGSWSILLTGMLASKQCVGLLEKIFDFLAFHKATKGKKDAETRRARAEARLKEAKAEMAVLKVHKERVKILYDYSVAVDSLMTSLRNAAFDNPELKIVLQEKVMKDIDVLSRHKSIGLIQSVTIRPLRLKGTQPLPPSSNEL